MARTLGAEGIGKYGYIISIISILITFGSIGFRQSIILFIKKNNKIVESIFSLSIFLSIFLTIVGKFLFLSNYYIFSDHLIFYDSKIFFLASYLFLSELLLSFIIAIFLGINQYSNYAKILIFNPITHIIILVIIFYFSEINVHNALLALSITNSITLFLSVYNLRSQIKFDFSLNIDLLIKMIKNGYLYAIALFLLSFIYNADILILKIFSSDDKLGAFIIANKIINAVCLFPQSIGTIYFSLKTKEEKNYNENKSKLILFKSSFILFCIFTLILYLTIPKMIIIFFGLEYFISGDLFRLLIPGLFGLFIIKTIYPDLAGEGNVKTFVPIFILAGIIKVILNITLISYLSVYGSAVASSITYLFIAMIMIYKYIKYKKIKLKNMFIPTIKEINSLFNNSWN